MAQHDYVIDNGPGLAVRTDINAVLQAIVSNNSGNIEPQALFPGMLWLDTASDPPELRLRDQGNTAWALPNVGQFTKMKRTVRASSGSFTYDSDSKYAIVEVLGGGGGGGASSGTAAGTGSAAAGGGGGAWASRLLEVPASKTATLTVAAAVAGSATGGQSVYNDGTVAITANGGNPGGAATATGGVITFSGGAGGTAATGHDIATYGDTGEFSLVIGNTASSGTGTLCRAGSGGNSRYGRGGTGPASSTGAAYNAAGGVAVGYGGGGGGGLAMNGNSAAPGGASTGGLIIITEIG
jgi:hypothetical protein